MRRPSRCCFYGGLSLSLSLSLSDSPPQQISAFTTLAHFLSIWVAREEHVPPLSPSLPPSFCLSLSLSLSLSISGASFGSITLRWARPPLPSLQWQLPISETANERKEKMSIFRRIYDGFYGSISDSFKGTKSDD